MTWAVTSRNLHCTMYTKHGLLMCTDPMMYFDRRVSAYVLFGEWSILIMKTWVKTSTKRISVRQKWPNHGTPVEWEYQSSISWTYQCSCDVKRQAFSSFWCMSSHLFSTTCCLGQPNSAARDVIWICTWEFHKYWRECVRWGNSQTKHGQMVPSCARQSIIW